jgi:hypothetical protein
MTSVKDVVQQLRVAIGKLDQAVVTAERAKVDAEEAYQRFAAAGKGSDHPQLNKARAQALLAIEAADRATRLYTEAAQAYARYINHISGGSVPERRGTRQAMPTGESLVNEAESRESRAAKFHRKATEAVADQQEDMQKFEESSRQIARAIRGAPGPDHAQPGVGSNPTAGPAQPAESQHPVADVMIAAVGFGLAAKSIADKIRKARERKQTDVDQT